MAKEGVSSGDEIGVEVVRAKPAAKPIQAEQPEEKPADVPAVAARLDLLAKEAGLTTPATFRGKPVPSPRFWIYRAICVRFGWSENTVVGRAEFDAAVKEVSNITV